MTITPPDTNSWQAIETAPKDGRSILVYGKPQGHPGLNIAFFESGQFTAHYSELDQSFCINGGDWAGPFIDPSHWQPLPAPPGKKESDQ